MHNQFAASIWVDGIDLSVRRQAAKAPKALHVAAQLRRSIEFLVLDRIIQAGVFAFFQFTPVAHGQNVTL